uniref:F-box associated domain-containing protein n=1 Tax=Oryza glumipatula TaxID=40148 RepID=A0A0E0BBV8_9ORYZ
MACELVALDMETREFEVIVQGPPCRHGEGKMTVLELHGALCVACSDKATDAINIWMVNCDAVTALGRSSTV